MLTKSEQRVVEVFREYMMTEGQMLCFSGRNLEQNSVTLQRLSDKDLLSKERYKGGYSLTKSGYAAMIDCQ